MAEQEIPLYHDLEPEGEAPNANGSVRPGTRQNDASSASASTRRVRDEQSLLTDELGAAGEDLDGAFGAFDEFAQEDDWELDELLLEDADFDGAGQRDWGTQHNAWLFDAFDDSYDAAEELMGEGELYADEEYDEYAINDLLDQYAPPSWRRGRRLRPAHPKAPNRRESSQSAYTPERHARPVARTSEGLPGLEPEAVTNQPPECDAVTDLPLLNWLAQQAAAANSTAYAVALLRSAPALLLNQQDQRSQPLWPLLPVFTKGFSQLVAQLHQNPATRALLREAPLLAKRVIARIWKQMETPRSPSSALIRAILLQEMRTLVANGAQMQQQTAQSQSRQRLPSGQRGRGDRQRRGRASGQMDNLDASQRPVNRPQARRRNVRRQETDWWADEYEF